MRLLIWRNSRSNGGPTSSEFRIRRWRSHRRAPWREAEPCYGHLPIAPSAPPLNFFFKIENVHRPLRTSPKIRSGLHIAQTNLDRSSQTSEQILGEVRRGRRSSRNHKFRHVHTLLPLTMALKFLLT